MCVRKQVADGYKRKVRGRKAITDSAGQCSMAHRGEFRILGAILLYSLVMAMTLVNGVKAQSTVTREGFVYPNPPKTANRMFILQRTPNANTIACDLNLNDKGEVDLDDPLTTYWLRYGDQADGPRKELNFIQRHFAYGLNINKIGEGKYEFWFVSYKKYHMYLVRAGNGVWKVYGKINGHLSVLDSIFIYIKGGSFWNPHVVYVELSGKNPTSGKVAVERLSDVKKEKVS